MLRNIEPLSTITTSRKTTMMKNNALSVASAFSAIVGIAGLVGSAAILWLFLNETIYSVPVIAPIFRTFVGFTLYLGAFVITASLVHIGVGLLLWKRKRIGGYLGFALSALEALSYFSVLFLPNLALPMIVFLAIGSFLSILLVAAWDGLG